MAFRFGEINRKVIQAPSKSEIHCWVMRSVALKGNVLTYIDISTGWRQGDFGGIYGEPSDRAIIFQEC